MFKYNSNDPNNIYIHTVILLFYELQMFMFHYSTINLQNAHVSTTYTLNVNEREPKQSKHMKIKILLNSSWQCMETKKLFELKSQF